MTFEMGLKQERRRIESAAALVSLGDGLVVFDDGGGLDQLDAGLARLFGAVAFAGVGDDAAVGRFQAPTPFVGCVFVDVEFHFVFPFFAKAISNQHEEVMSDE
jgi:hypothetical protein